MVTDEEKLSRFVLFSDWVRNSDQTLRPDAFIPYPYPNLSVTRQNNLTEEEIWAIGQVVANVRPATLYGRGVIDASNVRRNELDVISDATPDNPNHANVVNWPSGKPAQKIIAQQIAAKSKYHKKP